MDPMLLALLLFVAMYVLLLIFSEHRWVIAPAAALIFLVLGIIGLVNHRSRYNDYKDSDDVRKVDAVITYVEVKSRKGDYDKKVYYWKADVDYEVNGEEYSGTTEFSTDT